MAGPEAPASGTPSEVDSYTRRTKSGRTITVEAYQRSNDGATEEALAIPGRPPMAAKPGSMAGGRSLPNIWIKPPTIKPLPPPPVDPVTAPPSEKALQAADKLGASVANHPNAGPLLAALGRLMGSAAPTADKTTSKVSAKAPAPAKPARRPGEPRLRDRSKPDNNSIKLSAAARNVIMLANGVVHVESYKRRNNKTGQLVDVEAYTQIRELVSALGGPQIAAKKGITAAVVTPVIPQAKEIFTGSPDALDPATKIPAKKTAQKVPAKKAAAKKTMAKKLPEPDDDSFVLDPLPDRVPTDKPALDQADQPPNPTANEPDQPDEIAQIAPPITRDQLSNPDTPRSRPVSAKEFQAIALRGKQRLEALQANSSDPDGLDNNLDRILREGYAAVQQEWGGITVDTHTGDLIGGTDEKYALTVKPLGMSSVSVPIDASPEEFDKAVKRARRQFWNELRGEQAHLGIFRDEDSNRIDIDPVLVVDNLDDAESIGAYTNNIGGAYAFHDGNGYWPPHVVDQPDVSEGGNDAGLQGAGPVASPGSGAAGGSPDSPEVGSPGVGDPGGAPDRSQFAAADAQYAAAKAAVADQAYQATVANGGVTISLGGSQPSQGLAYAPYKDTEELVPNGELTPEVIGDYMARHADQLAQPGNHLGMWEYEGNIYLDISAVGEPNNETVQSAIDAQQIAVFDLASFEEVPLGTVDETNRYTPIYASATDHPYLNGGKDASGGGSGTPGESAALPDGPGEDPAAAGPASGSAPAGGVADRAAESFDDSNVAELLDQLAPVSEIPSPSDPESSTPTRRRSRPGRLPDGPEITPDSLEAASSGDRAYFADRQGVVRDVLQKKDDGTWDFIQRRRAYVPEGSRINVTNEQINTVAAASDPDTTRVVAPDRSPVNDQMDALMSQIQADEPNDQDYGQTLRDRFNEMLAQSRRTFETNDPDWREFLYSGDDDMVNPDAPWAHDEYTAMSYIDINGVLRGDFSEKDTALDMNRVTRGMDMLYSEYAFDAKQDFVVTRGVRATATWDPGASFQVGQEFMERGYLSTTVDSSVTSNFSTSYTYPSYVMNIRVPHRTHYTHGTEWEREVILDRGTIMRVLRVEPRPGGQDITDVYLEVVEDDE